VDRNQRGLPTTLRAAIVLLLVQAASLAVLVVFLVLALGRQDNGQLVLRELLPFVVLAVIVAVVLVGLAWLLRRLRAWARSPVVALELMFIPVSYYLVGISVVGVLITLSAMASVTLLVAPATRTALGIRS
jgi:hypothetical protein